MNQNQCLSSAGQQNLFQPGDDATPADQFPLLQGVMSFTIQSRSNKDR